MCLLYHTPFQTAWFLMLHLVCIPAIGALSKAIISVICALIMRYNIWREALMGENFSNSLQEHTWQNEVCWRIFIISTEWSSFEWRNFGEFMVIHQYFSPPKFPFLRYYLILWNFQDRKICIMFLRNFGWQTLTLVKFTF